MFTPDGFDGHAAPADPGQPLLAGELRGQGYQVSHHSVARLLKDELGCGLQGNAKTIEGRQHPDRDGQFRYISGQVTAHLAAGEPVISVDAKKKELAGAYANKGRAGTTTRTGLTVRAEHDTGSYPRGIKVTDRQMRELKTRITRHDWHGEWNYCVNPAKAGVTITTYPYTPDGKATSR